MSRDVTFFGKLFKDLSTTSFEVGNLAHKDVPDKYAASHENEHENSNSDESEQRDGGENNFRDAHDNKRNDRGWKSMQWKPGEFTLGD